MQTQQTGMQYKGDFCPSTFQPEHKGVMKPLAFQIPQVLGLVQKAVIMVPKAWFPFPVQKTILLIQVGAVFTVHQ